MTSQPERDDAFRAAPPPKEVSLFHIRSDLDSSAVAQHHTLGIGPNKASPGNHSHDGKNSKKLATSALTSGWTAWTDIPTLTSCSWIGVPWNKPQYRVNTTDGQVQSRGLLTGNVAAATIFARLGTGTAPVATYLMSGFGTSGAVRYNVFSSGSVAVFQIDAALNGFFSIDNIQWSTL